jgi:dTDP-4-dehydrorhamnose 3,5-epimerase
MEVNYFPISGLIEVIPRVFHDERGFFFESYSARTFAEAGITETFVQDNQSFSQAGVIRGLHYLNPPHEQGKLVRVIKGRALDVVLDIRRNSPTFGQHQTVLLDGERQNMLYVPPGFAHGFSALEDTIFFYKCTSFYQKSAEGGIFWNDPSLKINWQVDNPILSEKDQTLPKLAEAIIYF